MPQQQVMHIGLDDTDSTKGGCTTYLAAVLVKELEKFNVEFIDYPSLIRLNPNVPWKTRGNGALCLRFTYEPKFEEEIKDVAMSLWEEHSAIKEKGTDPGIVLYKGAKIPEELKAFSNLLVQDSKSVSRVSSAFTFWTGTKACEAESSWLFR